MQEQHHRGHDWCRTLIFTLFQWSTQNSQIIFQETHPTFLNKDIKSVLFAQLVQLVTSAEQWPVEPTVGFDEKNFRAALLAKPPKRTKDQVEKERLRRDIPHYPHCLTGAAHRRQCRVHPFRRLTHSFCTWCGVFLCSKNCFQIFHTVKHYDRCALKNVDVFK